MSDEQVSNREFARTDLEFQKACEAAGIKPTVRCASKFRNRRGAAYEAHLKRDKQVE